MHLSSYPEPPKDWNGESQHQHPVQGGHRPPVSSEEYLHSLVGGVEPWDALDIQTVLYGYEVLCPAGPHRNLEWEDAQGWRQWRRV